MTDTPSKLLILWTNAQEETVHNMVFMYSVNARLHGWWDEVTLLIWGAPASLSAEDAEVQKDIARAREAGVRVIACKACAERLGVVDALKKQDVEVFYTGEFLTDWLKSGDKLLTI
jgi:hypothetical protein